MINKPPQSSPHLEESNGTTMSSATLASSALLLRSLAGRWLFKIPSTGIYEGDVALDMLVSTVLGWTTAL
jgi:hypothetical protein